MSENSRRKTPHARTRGFEGNGGFCAAEQRASRCGARSSDRLCRTISSQSGKESVLWQTEDADVLIHAHRIVVFAEGPEPDHRHEVALWQRRSQDQRPPNTGWRGQTDMVHRARDSRWYPGSGRRKRIRPNPAPPLILQCEQGEGFAQAVRPCHTGNGVPCGGTQSANRDDCRAGAWEAVCGRRLGSRHARVRQRSAGGACATRAGSGAVGRKGGASGGAGGMLRARRRTRARPRDGHSLGDEGGRANSHLFGRSLTVAFAA